MLIVFKWVFLPLHLLSIQFHHIQRTLKKPQNSNWGQSDIQSINTIVGLLKALWAIFPPASTWNHKELQRNYTNIRVTVHSVHGPKVSMKLCAKSNADITSHSKSNRRHRHWSVPQPRHIQWKTMKESQHETLDQLCAQFISFSYSALQLHMAQLNFSPSPHSGRQ